MNYYCYILQSQKNNKYYIGSCQNLQQRLDEHNAGFTKSTRYGRPWEIVYYEEFSTRAMACRREKQIKSYKGGNAFKKLINLGEVA